MRAGVIKVVVHNGEMFFESDGILVDRLDANDFYLADITVMRAGAMFEFCPVYTANEADPFSKFVGLDELFKDMPDRIYDCDELFPDYFEVGDELHFILSHPYDWDINYRQMYAEYQIETQLGPLAEELLNRDDEDSIEYELLSRKYVREYESLLSHFKFPPNPILRRIE